MTDTTFVGSLVDTKGSTISVSISEQSVILGVTNDPQVFSNPSAHMTASMAKELECFLLWALTIAKIELPDVGPCPVTDPNERGFKKYGEAFSDLEGNEIRLQESSAVGQECCWIFVADPLVPDSVRYKKPWSENTYKDPDIYLSAQMVATLCQRLNMFVESSQDESGWRNRVHVWHSPKGSHD